MYRHLLSAAFILGLLLFAAVSVQAYGGDGSVQISGEPAPTSGVCNDGNDSDGDGLTDGEDTGCTKVYGYDRSEYDMRDSDLTYAMYGNEELGPGDLSISQPGFVERSLDVRLEDCRTLDSECVYSSSIGGGTPQLVEYWIDGLGYAQWAGGTLENTGVSSSDSALTELNSEEADRDTYGAALVDNPVFGAITEDPEVETCGNGDRNMGEGKNTGCPQDWGLPDDLITSDGARTALQSSTDITDELGSFEVNVGENYYPWDVTQSDPPRYTMNMMGIEAYGGPSSNAIDADLNIQSPGEDPRSQKLYDHWGISDAPDYFTDGRELKAVYLHSSPQSIDTVKDYDIAGYNDDLTHYVLPDFGDRERITRGCYFSPDAEGWECDYSGKQYCIGNIQNHARNYSLEEDTVTVSKTNKWYSTRKPDSNNGKEWRDGGYEKVTTNHDLTVEVTRDVSGGYEQVDAYNCNNRIQESSCEEKAGVDNPNGTCIETNQQPVYEDAEPDYNGDRPGKVNEVVDGGSIDIKYDSLEYREKTVFSTDYSENEGLPSETDSIEALFSGDYDLADVEYNGPYYTIEPDYAYGDFSNSPAVSSSSFEIVVQDGKFHSKRDYYGVFNVDGTNGFGDSFIALKEGQITQEIPAFNRETAIVSPAGEKVGNSEGFLEASETNFVDTGDYSSPGECPENIIFCVAAVDLSIKEWGDWGNPAQPEFEFETIDKVHVNQSFGACRKYQELIGGPRESILRCQYDYANDFPSEPVPFHKPNLVGGDGS